MHSAVVRQLQSVEFKIFVAFEISEISDCCGVTLSPGQTTFSWLPGPARTGESLVRSMAFQAIDGKGTNLGI